jgi:hypothetical protein
MLPIVAAISLAFMSLDADEVMQASELQLGLARFPPYEVAFATREFGEHHYAWVSFLFASNQTADNLHWRHQAKAFRLRWGLLLEAQHSRVPLCNRIDAFFCLKNYLGDQDWQLGIMPGLPLQYFQEGPPPTATLLYLESLMKAAVIAEPPS